MCPACITTAALLVAGATWAGGFTALVVKKLGSRNDTKSNGGDHAFVEPKEEERGA
ncbi:MAG: hypothetical protein ACREQY_09230 [Candidatus Binatia bacterium]